MIQGAAQVMLGVSKGAEGVATALGLSPPADGDEAQDYNKVVVNYTGTLLDGSIFDSSLKPGRTPFTFTLGAGSVIKGWDQGLVGMCVG